ncbi:hypothetical protein FSST1_007680 [Fusarium sambucinum]
MKLSVISSLIIAVPYVAAYVAQHRLAPNTSIVDEKHESNSPRCELSPLPILLAAHQDVVPVSEDTLDDWDHPPFDGYYDQCSGYFYGRGAADDKAAITGLMSAVEGLLSQDDYNARRAVVLAFGFDHECSGNHSAGEIAKYLEQNMERTELQSYSTRAAQDYSKLTVSFPGTTFARDPVSCLDIPIRRSRHWWEKSGRFTRACVSLGVSHGLAPQDTVRNIEHGVVQLVQSIVNKYNLRFEPFEEDDDYDDYLLSEGLAREARKQGSSSGTLNMEAMRKYFPAAPAPTSGRVWDTFAGTIRYTWGTL